MTVLRSVWLTHYVINVQKGKIKRNPDSHFRDVLSAEHSGGQVIRGESRALDDVAVARALAGTLDTAVGDDPVLLNVPWTSKLFQYVLKSH